VGGRVGAVSVRADGVDLMRGGVCEIQRARILAGLVEVTRERGAGRVTVAHIVERSGVSRRTFYEMFEDRDACFLAAFEDAVQRAAARVAPAFSAGASSRPWRERVRAGLLALLEFLDEEPGLGGLCVVDALGAGPRALDARARVVARLVDAVAEGRADAKPGLKPSRLTAEGVVGGVLAVLYARLSEGAPAQRSAGTASKAPSSSARASGTRVAGAQPSSARSSTARSGAATTTSRRKPLVGLLNPLMGAIVLPYLGAAAAARESARPTPKARRRRQPVRSNPLEGLDMRLTYRTVQVLGAIASRPGASNRQVADAAGVVDQGQISKLLARLEQAGLVSNDGVGPTLGEPNAWRLTPRGQEIQHTIREQTAPTGA
jgi:AcrR family transcriptional regulator/DNA-binding MarR family transcriptional regulator